MVIEIIILPSCTHLEIKRKENEENEGKGNNREEMNANLLYSFSPHGLLVSSLT